MRRLSQLALVGMGGAAGAVLRWALLEALRSGATFPWATLVANLAGCALLGAITSRSMPEQRSWLLGAGFCGGLTTMSTFAVEVVELLDAEPLTAGLYLAASIGGGLTAFVLGRNGAANSGTSITETAAP